MIVGSGAAGLPAAIKAVEGGASVIVVETNYDVGGHAILSGGHMALGGGTSAQKKYGIPDSPDMVFSDLTDWSIVQPNGWPDFRYNDRAVMRAFADHCALTYEFLLANGVEFTDKAPDNHGASTTGNSAPRENHAFWTKGAGLESPNAAAGTGVIRPLEASARAKGVRFLLNYKMTSLIREPSAEQKPGRVIGITAQYTPRIMPGATTPLKSFRSDGNIESTKPTMNLRATKAVIIATGGSTSNINFRRMFDPRMTAVIQVGGEPYSYQDASGELAAMAIGASLWGLANQTLENGATMRTQRALATKYNYTTWKVESPIFPLVRATGFNVKDWQDVILVNQVGKRFYDETKGDPAARQSRPPNRPVYAQRLSQCRERQVQSDEIQFYQCGDGDERVLGAARLLRRADVGDLRCGCSRTGRMEGHAAARGSGRLFLFREHARRTRRRDQERISGQADEGRDVTSDGGALQLVRRRGRRQRFRQAGAQIQNSNAAVLCCLGDAGGARHARRLENQCEVPGDRHERQSDSRSLLRRRVGRRLQSTWHGPLRHAGIHRRYGRSEVGEA